MILMENRFTDFLPNLNINIYNDKTIYGQVISLDKPSRLIIPYQTKYEDYELQIRVKRAVIDNAGHPLEFPLKPNKSWLDFLKHIKVRWYISHKELPPVRIYAVNLEIPNLGQKLT